MPQEKNLTRRQRAVIEDLFTAEMDEQDVLDKHKVSGALYSRWLADERFVGELERRMAQAYRLGRLILARYATVAAGKLVHLTDCEKEEVARKACLDIITLDNPAPAISPNATSDPSDTGPTELPPETARRILAALAGPPSDTEITSP
jgi:hypothetical protein